MQTSKTKLFLNSQFQEIEKVAEKKLNEFKLIEKGWKFKFDRAKKRAGCCNFSKKTISLSKFYCQNSSFKEILNAILHEIAHAIVGHNHNHDTKWKSKAIEIGCDAQKTLRYNFSKAPYTVGCINGCWHVKRFRINKKWLLNNCCSICGSKINLY